MNQPAPARAKTDIKALNPLTSKPGTLALLQTQAEYLLKLLVQIPSKGTFAIHKARVLAATGPQLTDWNSAKEALLMEHAVTVAVNSETPDAGRRLVVYTKDEVDTLRAEALKAASDAAKLDLPAPPAVVLPLVDQAKFVSDEAHRAFNEAYVKFNKELLITWDVGSVANLHAGITAVLKTLSGEQCPTIEDADIFMFERLIEEIEVALAPAAK
jgi:hypothetical protein